MRKCILLVAVTAACLCGSSHLWKGDMNLDGQINVADLTSLINIVMGTEPARVVPLDTITKGDTLLVSQPTLMGDMNLDGRHNVADITAMVNVIMGTDPQEDVARDTIINPHSSEAHEFVDLALPSGTLWATCNLGADRPEEAGHYYAWAETEGGKPYYSWENYKYATGGGREITKYCLSSDYGNVDNKMNLDAEDDAATMEWGKSWSIPTEQQYHELTDTTNCQWAWVEKYHESDTPGYVVTSKRNGRQIFMPAVGLYNNNGLENDGFCGLYWSSALCADQSNYALYFYFDEEELLFDNYNRSNGLAIRPIKIINEQVKVSSIILSPKIDTLNLNDSIRLTATVLPENATFKNLSWRSSDESIISVSSDGMLTSISEGTATITASARDGSGVSTSITMVSINLNIIDGHEFVDLGLPSGTRWAICNVGAKFPWEYGDYFSWGETVGRMTGKSSFAWQDYKYSGKSVTQMTKYNNNDQLKILEEEDDAAYVQWGSHWRIPTLQQQKELSDTLYTKWEWVSDYQGNKVNGYVVTSIVNGKEIFLPAAGYYQPNMDFKGERGSYWLRNVYNITSMPYNARCLRFFESKITSVPSYRYYGESIRAVCEKK